MEKTAISSSMSANFHPTGSTLHHSHNLYRFGGLEDRRHGIYYLKYADVKSFNTFHCGNQIPIGSHRRHLGSTSHRFAVHFPKLSSSVAESQCGTCDTLDSCGHFVKVVNHQQKVVTSQGVIKQAIKALVILTHQLSAPVAFAAIQASGVGGGIKNEVLSSAWMGFFSGCLHTLSGPDHLAALAPLSIGRTHVESVVIGALWGCGHDAGQLIFGLVFLLIKDRLQIEVIKTWGTRAVGLTLLAMGAMGIREASQGLHPCVAPENGKKKMGFATFATGVVHGLQPDSILIVFPALALPSRWHGAAFLAMFFLGTVLAMAGYTLLLTCCSQALKEKMPQITEKMTWVSSLLAIALGLAVFAAPFFGFGL